MARKSKEEALETRNRILTAAVDLIAEKGYARTTFEDIAERLELTKGAVYWHFKTKPDLLSELILLATKLRLEALGEPKVFPRGAIKEYFVRWARHIVEHPLARKLFYLFEFQVEFSSELLLELRQRLRNRTQGPHEIISQELNRLVESGEADLLMPPKELAVSFSGSWFGIVKGWFFHNRQFDLPAMVGKVFDAMETSFIRYREK